MKQPASEEGRNQEKEGKERFVKITRHKLVNIFKTDPDVLDIASCRCHRKVVNREIPGGCFSPLQFLQDPKVLGSEQHQLACRQALHVHPSQETNIKGLHRLVLIS